MTLRMVLRVGTRYGYGWTDGRYILKIIVFLAWAEYQKLLIAVHHTCFKRCVARVKIRMFLTCEMNIYEINISGCYVLSSSAHLFSDFFELFWMGVAIHIVI